MNIYILCVMYYFKTRVRILLDEKKPQTTKWSDIFSLDAVGSEGIFKCEVPDSNHVYQVHAQYNII